MVLSRFIVISSNIDLAITLTTTEVVIESKNSRYGNEAEGAGIRRGKRACERQRHRWVDGWLPTCIPKITFAVQGYAFIWQ